jgi:hypothetical protein
VEQFETAMTRSAISVRIAAISILLLVTACASLERLPAVPASETSKAQPLGLPNARFFPAQQRDDLIAEGERAIERRRQALGVAPNAPLPPGHFLAISGGGDDGAFGSGVLVGWTEAGGRPDFDIVTGVSTGSLIAPFAFLGSAYDPQLRQVYTTISPDDIYVSRGIVGGIFSDALSDTTPLSKTISRFFDMTMMNAVAQEYMKGRLLLIGTTNLDAEQPVIWNIGAIAATGTPEALELIRRVLRASSAIPGYFQPVMIDVTLNGQHFQELHVDGGAIAQIFLYPPNISLSRFMDRDRQAFLIRNAREDPMGTDVQRRTLSIGGRAISVMLRASGSNDLTRIYFVTQRDGVDYNLAYIGSDFTVPHPTANFDKAYMNALFDYGYRKARGGYPWLKTPPLLMGVENEPVTARLSAPGP